MCHHFVRLMLHYWLMEASTDSSIFIEGCNSSFPVGLSSHHWQLTRPVASPAAGGLRRVQRAGPDGEQVFPGAAEIRHRRRQPAVLPLQLEVPQHGAETGQSEMNLAGQDVLGQNRVGIWLNGDRCIY